MVAFENKAQFLFQKVTKTLEQEFETNRLNIKNLGARDELHPFMVRAPWSIFTASGPDFSQGKVSYVISKVDLTPLVLSIGPNISPYSVEPVRQLGSVIRTYPS